MATPANLRRTPSFMQSGDMGDTIQWQEARLVRHRDNNGATVDALQKTIEALVDRATQGHVHVVNVQNHMEWTRFILSPESLERPEYLVNITAAVERELGRQLFHVGVESAEVPKASALSSTSTCEMDTVCITRTSLPVRSTPLKWSLALVAFSLFSLAAICFMLHHMFTRWTLPIRR